MSIKLYDFLFIYNGYITVIDSDIHDLIIFNNLHSSVVLFSNKELLNKLSVEYFIHTSNGLNVFVSDRSFNDFTKI